MFILRLQRAKGRPHIHIKDIGKLPSLKICLSIFDETTGKQQLMMALLKIGYDWMWGAEIVFGQVVDNVHKANVIISDIQSIFMSYLMVTFVLWIGGFIVW